MMMPRLLRPATLSLLLFFASCSMAPVSGPHATVLLRDGTRASGGVVSSSASEIQIVGDDRVTRTIPMSQVRSIDYGETTPAASGASAPADRRPALDAVHADNHYHATETAITTKTYELAPGTQISVRNEETIDSGRAVEGQTFAAEVSRDVLDESESVVIPRGANAQIVIRSASKGGKIEGQSDLVLDLQSVSVDGRRYLLDTRDIVRRGQAGVGKNKRTAEFTGGGAAIGALIGAIAGHGKGAAIGAGSGAGAGALAQVLTRGDNVKVPVESLLTFRLDSPLRVVAAR
jgi:hypothetical protein